MSKLLCKNGCIALLSTLFILSSVLASFSLAAEDSSFTHQIPGPSKYDLMSHAYTQAQPTGSNQPQQPLEHALAVVSISPKILTIGEITNVSFVFENRASVDVGQIIITLEPSHQLTVIGSAQRSLGRLKPREKKEVEFSLYPDVPTTISAPANATAKAYSCSLNLNMTYKQRFKYYTYETSIGGLVLRSIPELHLSGIKIERQGSFYRIIGDLNNAGEGKAMGVVLNLLKGKHHGEGTWVTNDLESDDFDTFEILVEAHGVETPNRLNLSFSIDYKTAGTLEKQHLDIFREVPLQKLPEKGFPVWLVALLVVVAVLSFYFYKQKRQKR